MNTRQRIFAFGVVVVALVLRVWMLDLKPAHFDEGVNGALIDEMRERGFYEYRPENYHGPLHFYVLFAGQQMFGRSLWVLRMPTVLIGVATVALMFAFRRWLPFAAVAVAAVATALSPAMVFYSRDAIHEMWLPFFTMLAVYGGFGCASDRRPSDRWALGLGLAGMVLTKETYLFHWIAAGISLLWVMVATPRANARDGRPDAAVLFARRRKNEVVAEEVAPPPSWWPVWAGCVGIVVAFYSGFGMNWAGVRGLWETWGPMIFKGFGTGETSEMGHHKPIFYYVGLLWHYEWPALLGMGVAVLAAAAPGHLISPQVRFLALFGLGSLAAYSLIPYKTPWCIVTVLPPFLLVLGWVAHRLFEAVGRTEMERAVVSVFVAMLLAQPAMAAWRLNFRNPTNDGGRYAYVQTSNDIQKLLGPVKALVARDARNRTMVGHVFVEGHPLHWEFGDLPNVGFCDKDHRPDSFEADFLVVPDSRVWEVEAELRGVYFKERYRTRDFGEPGWLYLAASRFGAVMGEREPEFHRRIPQEVPR
jgi:uncharacterized protein (TIGR03663 family)